MHRRILATCIQLVAAWVAASAGAPASYAAPSVVAGPSRLAVDTSITSSVAVNPSQLPAESGGVVAITATFTSPGTMNNVSLDIEVLDRAQNKVFQQLYLDQAFGQGQSQSYTATWVVPSTTANGFYTVKTGAFSPDWASGYGWNDGAAQITVGDATGVRYYLDCASTDRSPTGLDPVHAFATLAQANQAQLRPGDSLLLNRGCTWTGRLNAGWNGTPGEPIAIGAYGSGNPPRIGGSSSILVDVTGSYLNLDGLALSATPDRLDPGCRNQAVGDRTGVYFQENANHNTLQNFDFTSLSVGVNLGHGSTYNSVAHNVFHDVNMMFTLTPQNVNNNDDAGGQNVLISGDYNEISYNTFTGASTCEYDYSGVTGQAFVLYGGQHNTIHHNRASGNGANFMEAGANVGASQRPADDNTLAFNVSVGSHFVTVHGTGDGWGPALRTRLFNNVSYTRGSGSIACEGCGLNILQMRNNIIWADRSATLDVDAPIDEAYNIFWSRSGNPYNSVEISPTSRVVDPQFVDPDAGNFHLEPTSPALNAGAPDPVNAGFSVDLDGNSLSLSALPAIGVYVR